MNQLSTAFFVICECFVLLENDTIPSSVALEEGGGDRTHTHTHTYTHTDTHTHTHTHIHTHRPREVGGRRESHIVRE